jgi:HSP20 family molecular chaperone IbpA
MEKKEKRVIAPSVNVAHINGDRGLRIDINMAGATKKSLGLEMGKEGFCVKAEAKDFRYHTCYMLAHRVKAKEANAKFNSGLLTVEVPFDESMRSHKVAIH